MPDDSSIDLLRAVGAMIRDARDRAGLTQAQVADRIGLTRSSVANMEGGRQRLNLVGLAKMARVLRLDLNELTALVDLPPGPPAPHVVLIRPVLEVSCRTCGGTVLDVVGTREAAGESRAVHVAAMLEKETGDA